MTAAQRGSLSGEVAVALRFRSPWKMDLQLRVRAACQQACAAKQRTTLLRYTRRSVSLASFPLAGLWRDCHRTASRHKPRRDDFLRAAMGGDSALAFLFGLHGVVLAKEPSDGAPGAAIAPSHGESAVGAIVARREPAAGREAHVDGGVDRRRDAAARDGGPTRPRDRSSAAVGAGEPIVEPKLCLVGNRLLKFPAVKFHEIS